MAHGQTVPQCARQARTSTQGNRAAAARFANRPDNSFERRASAAGKALPGLPRDARASERHRCGCSCNAGSHACANCFRCDGARKTRLCSEAVDMVHRRRTAARAQGKGQCLATQMGNQGHSWDDARKAVEYVWAGSIGEMREVHVWTNRPLGYWPQGIPWPEPLKTAIEKLPWNGAGINARLANSFAGSYPIPESLAWDLFLGPAPFVEYHPIYHPFNWRGWVDWGNGPLGDMGAHLMDVAMWALDLGFPTTIETIATPFNSVSYPNATMTMYEFPALGNKPAVKMTWYDGGLLPAKPIELGEQEELNKGGGALLIGSKGKLLHDTYGRNPRLLPLSLHESFGTPQQRLPRIADESHEMNWVNAAKGLAPASCPFEYAAELTEVMLLGIVALKAGRKIEYDASNMRVVSVSAANEYLRRQPRPGWSQ